ncbi:MAG: type II toxin-antitoxin system VapC family toxin [Ignavibacteriae bacterium]|nr:type II toxin-antitoxin system VapC family toxin [Ignavibacteriota bacterium]
MKYVFDTNICIRILKGDNTNIFNKISTIDIDSIAIPSVVRYELYYGAYKSRNQESTLTKLSQFITSFADIPFDYKSSEICGRIRAELEKKGTPIRPYDLMIASIAISHNLILITNNTREFSRINNLKIEDWVN